MSAVADDDTMHKAARRGDLEAVRRFVEVDGVDVDCRDPHGHSALHEAVVGNCVLMQPMVRYLISKNANVEAKTTIGFTSFTPLMVASFYGHSDTVRILLEEGSANVNYCRESGATALFDACSSSNKYRVVSTLLENGADAMVPFPDGRSLLHHAVTSDVDICRALLLRCRETLTELDFCNLLLQANQGVSIPLHHTKLANIAKLLIEQPRRKHDNQLLSVCQAQLVSKNGSGRTPREHTAMRQQDTSDAQLLSYLERYETSALSIPGDPSSASKRHNLNNMSVAVKLNPALNDFQHSVAQEAFDLIIDTTDCMDETAHAVLGYLSLLDVMKRTDLIA